MHCCCVSLFLHPIFLYITSIVEFAEISTMILVFLVVVDVFVLFFDESTFEFHSFRILSYLRRFLLHFSVSFLIPFRFRRYLPQLFSFRSKETMNGNEGLAAFLLLMQGLEFKFEAKIMQRQQQQHQLKDLSIFRNTTCIFFTSFSSRNAINFIWHSKPVILIEFKL